MEVPQFEDLIFNYVYISVFVCGCVHLGAGVSGSQQTVLGH